MFALRGLLLKTGLNGVPQRLVAFWPRALRSLLVVLLPWFLAGRGRGRAVVGGRRRGTVCESLLSVVVVKLSDSRAVGYMSKLHGADGDSTDKTGGFVAPSTVDSLA